RLPRLVRRTGPCRHGRTASRSPRRPHDRRRLRRFGDRARRRRCARGHRRGDPRGFPKAGPARAPHLPRDTVGRRGTRSLNAKAGDKASMSSHSDSQLNLIVTGGAGYVGSVCAARLLESGHRVTVVDDLSTGHRDAVPAEATFVEGDIAEVADDLLADGFDGVLHFAGKSLVGESMQAPDKYWHGNVMTTLRLLDAMRRHRTPRLVFSSTAATYCGPATIPIPEDAATNPTNTYGATKLAVDHMISSYATAHGLAAVSLRYFNVAGAYGRFGERHTSETHLIPIVLQVAAGVREQVQIFGD